MKWLGIKDVSRQNLNFNLVLKWGSKIQFGARDYYFITFCDKV